MSLREGYTWKKKKTPSLYVVEEKKNKDEFEDLLTVMY